MLFGANSLYNNKQQYAGEGTPAASVCVAKNPAAQSGDADFDDKICTLEYTFENEFNGPLYLYYEITNYHQNNIKYSSSVNWDQMMGKKVPMSELTDKCSSMTTTKDANGKTLTLSPCGLISASFFTDKYKFKTGTNPNNYEISTDNIIGPLDQSLFQQPEGFQKKAATCLTKPIATDNECASVNYPKGCGCADENGQTWLYTYPDNDNTLYLYEQYPDNISPLVGVTDPHFMNWMNIAALPTFRKLYGRIDGKFTQGTKLVIEVDSNYDVSTFKGTKSLVLSTTGALGVKNSGLGVTYIVSGSIMVFFALVFFIKHECSPRPLGSPKQLNWNR